jgi:hypothetical protein
VRCYRPADAVEEKGIMDSAAPMTVIQWTGAEGSRPSGGVKDDTRGVALGGHVTRPLRGWR